MRNRTNNATASTGNKERTFTKVESFSVKNSREWDNGTVTTTLTLNGISIHNVRIMQTHDGNHEFLAFPSRKGNDGKYYPYVYVSLCDEDTEKIIEAIDEDLASKE